MNWDQVEGNWKQVKGAVREKWGKLTDDDLVAAEGRAASKNVMATPKNKLKKR